MEGTQSSACSEAMRGIAPEVAASKTEHGENFPVASLLIAPRLRPLILSFYRFARAADDIADHPTLSESSKFERLAALENTLLGKSDSAEAALALRRVLAEKGLPPAHPLDLLTAFRADVTKRRYANWGELMHYCRYSAMPVGRFVLDLHGEDQSTWVYSDPLCSALQVINHLQDCAKDYCELDRVYLPLDMLTAHGADVAALAAPRATPALGACLRSIAARAATLMPAASRLPLAVRDLRIGLETGAIVRLAHKLLAILMIRDPLSEEVHLARPSAALQALGGAATTMVARLRGGAPVALRSRRQ
jgi:hydroxysqualene synthase